MNLPAFVRVQPDGVVALSVKVQPRASSNEICEAVGNELKVRITAPPKLRWPRNRLVAR